MGTDYASIMGQLFFIRFGARIVIVWLVSQVVIMPLTRAQIPFITTQNIRVSYHLY